MENFVKQGKERFGDFIDYSKVVYKNSTTKVKLICKNHGEFEQQPFNHLVKTSKGCPKCAGKQKKTTADYINDAKEKHGEQYDYSKVVYETSKSKIIIGCKSHGDFETVASSHLVGTGCPKCGIIKRAKNQTKTNDVFIIQANNVHENLYDYSKTVYVADALNVIIICKKHGEFLQCPSNHLQGKGCNKCAHENLGMMKKRTTEEFIRESKQIFGDLFDYSKTVYTGANDRIIYFCKIHGEINQIARQHLKGNGCLICSGAKILTTDNFIARCISKHGNLYDYSQVKYVNYGLKVEIICKNHGVFFQTPRSHLRGVGCPSCNNSRGESFIRTLLEKFEIEFEEQKKFEGCVCEKQLRYDFYLPKFNICVEYDGIQHFEPVKHFGGQEHFERTKKRDGIKTKFCEDNKIRLVRISYKIKKEKIETFLEKLSSNR